MKKIILLFVIGLFTTWAFSQELLKPKIDYSYKYIQSSDREGGEDIANALPISGLPFNDTGNTCDNIDDYDEACPYTGSDSPDVVYSYTPTWGEIITIDLCGSSYDTKVFVYEAIAGNLVACDDDFYKFGDACGSWVSKIEDLNLLGGQTYYIVIDGYGGDCGDYELLITGVPAIPISNWALGIGLLLISGFIVVRYRRRFA